MFLILQRSFQPHGKANVQTINSTFSTSNLETQEICVHTTYRNIIGLIFKPISKV